MEVVQAVNFKNALIQIGGKIRIMSEWWMKFTIWQ